MNADPLVLVHLICPIIEFVCLGYTNMYIDLNHFSARRGRPGYEEEAKIIVK